MSTIVESWDIGGVTRKVTLGNIVNRGAPPEGRSDWFKALEGALRTRGLASGTHWVRAYHALSPDAAPTIEVLVDNEKRPELEQALARFAWPPASSFFSVRIFFVLSGGLDVGRAAAQMIAHASLDDGALGRELTAHGISDRDAQRLLAFVPLAFGRVLVEKLQVRFPETALVLDAGAEREIRLADEPVFVEATALARRGTLTRAEFGALARRGAEINALNKALNAGSKPEDLLFSSPVVTLS